MTRSRISHSNIANVPNLGRRNVIINGAKNIDQRGFGGGAAYYTIASTGNIFNVDRWATFVSQASKIGVAQQSGTADVPNTDFKYSSKVTSLSAFSAASGDYFGYNTTLEVNDVQHFGFGTSSPKQFTISFWVKSSLTGNFGLAIRVKPSSPARSFVTTYTINTANTWEYKTLTLTAESNTAWTAQGAKGSGFNLWFDLGTGSDFHGTANQYNAGNKTNPSGTVSLVATNAATWQITGVQVELGAVATEFEHRPAGLERSLCERYYQHYGTQQFFATQYQNSYKIAHVHFPTRMRAAPDLTYSTQGGSGWSTYNVGDTQFKSYVASAASATANHYVHTVRANAEIDY